MLPARTYARFARRLLEQRLGRGLPLWVSWFINAECQIRCGGCFFFSRRFDIGEPLDHDGRFALLEQLIELRQPFVTMLGGEPFQCPDLFPLAKRAREGGIAVEVTTNGLDVDPGQIDNIDTHFHRFWVSIDGPREAHDLGRGPGTWDRAMETLRGALAHRRRGMIGVSTVISDRNAETMPRFLRMLRSVGVDQVCLKDNLMPELRAPDDSLQRSLDRIIAIKRETPGFIQQEEPFLRSLVQRRQRPHSSCSLQRHLHIALLPDGTVSACVSFPVPIGRVREQPLREILRPGPPERYAGRRDCPGCTRNDIVLFERLIDHPWQLLSPRQLLRLLYT